MTEQKSDTKKSRKPLILILLVSVTPIAAAYFMFFTGLGVPKHTVNYGTLLAEPMSLQSLLAADTWQKINEDKKWRLVLPVGEDCSEQCSQQLYTTRQVHIRLGDKSDRVERYALNFGGEKGRQYLADIASDHPLLKHAEVDAAAWQQWLDNSSTLTALEADAFYLLVDQEGMAMMVYTDQHGNDLLKDIKRALKYSIDFTR